MSDCHWAKAGRAALLVGLAVDEVAFLVEVVGYGSMDRGELLERFHVPESQARPLPSLEGQVAAFHPIVLPAPPLAAVGIARIAHRRRAGPQSIRDDHLRSAGALQSFPHECQSPGFVTFPRVEGLHYLALVINRAPQVMRLAIDLHVHLVEVPAPLAEAPDPRHPLPTNITSVRNKSTSTEPSRGRCRSRARIADPRHSAGSAGTARTAFPRAGSLRVTSENIGTDLRVYEVEACLDHTSRTSGRLSVHQL